MRMKRLDIRIKLVNLSKRFRRCRVNQWISRMKWGKSIREENSWKWRTRSCRMHGSLIDVKSKCLKKNLKMHVKHKFKVRMKKAKARVKNLIHGMLLNLIKVVLKHKLINYLTIKLTCTKTNSSLSKVSISRSRNQLKKSKPILLKSKINLSNSPSNNCNLET